ncbi:MAG: HlyD family efflux transporter periplasmic adaptor subunit, partial [Nitrospiraceae bacterium]|nr:HlyD family efflux transporter periplasmic adaptor subunit [Nitrospiraceae bacterium]
LNETDLSKATVYSPINGVVLKRAVDPGQTVAATFQTPLLFTLAEDLSKMELHVDVDEADIGMVRSGQKATFTVDAYPDRRFPAHITQVRFGPKTVAGVVTYETVMRVDNSELLLRPGMTATANIVVKHIDKALLVPNAALRFVPPPQDESASSSGGLVGRLLPHPPRSMFTEAREKLKGKRRRVWIIRNGRLFPIKISIGATDGIMTEVKKGKIKPGLPLVVDVIIRH